MSLTKIITTNNDIKLGIRNMQEPLMLLEQQSSKIQQDIVYNKLRLEKRKKEWLISRLILQELLGYYPNIYYNNSGKPHLHQSKKHISISHTHNFVTASVSDKPTAIDIEMITPKKKKVPTATLR